MEQINGADIAQTLFGTVIEGVLTEERKAAHARVLDVGTQWINNSPDWLGLDAPPQQMELFIEQIAQLIVSCANAAANIQQVPELPLDWGA